MRPKFPFQVVVSAFGVNDDRKLIKLITFLCILFLLSSPFMPESDKIGTLDAVLSGAYCRSQMYLSRQIARLRPELTMSMFSGEYLSVR